jgi:hypothetical protein
LQWGSNALGVWPVTNVLLDAHGFCETTLGEFGLFVYGFGAGDIGKFSSQEASQSFRRSGIGAGCLMRRRELEGSHPYVITHTPQTPIYDYELEAEYRPEGLCFAISGHFATDHDSDIGQERPKLNSDAFSLVATIPWEILVLKNSPEGALHWKFGHAESPSSKGDSLERTRHPRKLRDVLIDRTLGSALVRGGISLAPESALPAREDRYATSGFVHTNIGEITSESISFSDAPRVEILDNGFARSSIAIRRLTITMLSWSQLERELDRRDSLSMSLAGDALGWAGYAIDGTERVQPNMVSQQIKSISLRMALGERGLEISAYGELKDLDPAKNLRHREDKNLQNLLSNPIRTYELAATVPWALLVVRQVQFAHRARFF